MQTSKYEIGANLQGLEFRRQANEILAALASSNAGDLEPAAAQAGTVWLDTSNNKKHLLKIRNKANSAWGILCSIDAQSGVVDTIDAYTKAESDGKFTLKTDFEASKQDTGYIKLPNGLIIQWGKTGRYPPGVTKIKETQLFPIAFPNKCLSITSQVQDHSINDHNASEEVQNRNIFVKINYTTKGGFIFAMHTPSGTEVFGWEFYWMAIGY